MNLLLPESSTWFRLTQPMLRSTVSWFTEGEYEHSKEVRSRRFGVG
jgi:hypothetical protein